MSLNFRLTSRGLLVMASLLVAASMSSAQHLNPIVEKLSQGKVVVGVGSGDYSIDNAHALARADIDFVRLEMEHGPLDIDKIYVFLNEMVDRAGILKKGNGQISVAPIARFPPYGRESSLGVTKQGLDAPATHRQDADATWDQRPRAPVGCRGRCSS